MNSVLSILSLLYLTGDPHWQTGSICINLSKTSTNKQDQTKTNSRPWIQVLYTCCFSSSLPQLYLLGRRDELFQKYT